jgi:undecaprenyl-diphosphatase
VWLVIAVVLAVLRRRPEIFLWTLVAVACAEGISGALKSAIHRPRPSTRFAEPHPLVSAPHTASFPSGHATIAFACAGVLAWLVPRGAPAFFLLAAAIAWSRVYVGVHYPLDVLGGAVLGIGIATALRWLATTRRRSPRATRPG